MTRARASPAERRHEDGVQHVASPGPRRSAPASPVDRPGARTRRPSRGTASCFRRRTSGCSKRPTAPRGRSRIRSWTRSASPTARTWPTSAPAPAGSPRGWRAASGPTASSTRRTCSGRCSTRSGGACSARVCANVRTVLGEGSSPNLPPHALDAVLVVDAYQEVQRAGPRRRSCSNLAIGLKPDGRIGIVNYKLGGGGPGPDDPGLRVPRASVESDAAAAGLKVEAVGNLPYQYLLVLGRESDRGRIPVDDLRSDRPRSSRRFAARERRWRVARDARRRRALLRGAHRGRGADQRAAALHAGAVHVSADRRAAERARARAAARRGEPGALSRGRRRRPAGVRGVGHAAARRLAPARSRRAAT